MSPWSWTALGLWTAKACLVGLFTALMTFGPQLEDHAWDLGAHVTPAQAAMHAALQASGFTNHHHEQVPDRQAVASHSEGQPTAQRSGPGLTWGAPFGQALRPEFPPLPTLTGMVLGNLDGPAPATRALPPTDPPPRIW